MGPLLITTLITVITAFSSAQETLTKVEKTVQVEYDVAPKQLGLEEVYASPAGRITPRVRSRDAGEVRRFRNRLNNMRSRIRANLRNGTTETKEQIEHFRARHSHRNHIRPDGDNLMEVNENAKISEDLYQGDIVLTDDQMDVLEASLNSTTLRAKRQALADNVNAKWSTFYYSFDSGLPESQRRVFRIAAKYWNDNLCVNFIESYTATPRVNVIYGNGCYSNLGLLNRQTQDLSLGKGCDSVGTALHEIGHALGFFHEQSRFDRDDAIQVMTQNVMDGWLDQFNKQSQSMNNNHGMPYDYGSIMQYQASAVSRNGQPTMIARKPQWQDTMGGDIFSFRDLYVMNARYQCQARCGANAAKCQSAGFVHPRDCSKCICPTGFGGPLCTERKPGCGDWIAINDGVELHYTFVFGDGQRVIKDELGVCNYIFYSPSGRKIKARFSKYNANACVEGCGYGGVELKFQQDYRLTGPRYCCQNDVGQEVTSHYDILPMILYNRYGKEDFTLVLTAV